MGGCCPSSFAKTKLIPGQQIPFSTISDEVKLDCKFKAVITNHYKFVRICGHGKFGTVREAIKLVNSMRNGLYKQSNLVGSISNKRYAIKSIMKLMLRDKQQMLKKEILALKLCDHPNIVRLYEVFEDDKYLHLVMDLCTGPDLLEYLLENGPMPEQRIAYLIRKVLIALDYLHNVNICHRDIKPENMMFGRPSEDSELMLVDFGMSAKFSEFDLRSAVGTPYFMAPEVLNRIYSKECDIWSVGVTIYFLYSLSHPFKGSNLRDLMQKIRSGKFVFKSSSDFPGLWRNSSPEMRDLIKQMLIVNPAERITIRQALQHNWFQKMQDSKQGFQITQQIVGNLSRPKTFGKLQKEVIKVLVRNLDADTIAALRELFTYLDKERSGLVSTADILHALEYGGTDIAKAELNQIIQNFDKNYEGKLKYSEFLAMALDAKELLEEENLWVAFKHFDTDNDNLISIQDFQGALQKAGCFISQQELAELTKEFQLQALGFMDFDRFKSIMLCFSPTSTPECSSSNIDTSSIKRLSQRKMTLLKSGSDLESLKTSFKVNNHLKESLSREKLIQDFWEAHKYTGANLSRGRRYTAQEELQGLSPVIDNWRLNKSTSNKHLDQSNPASPNQENRYDQTCFPAPYKTEELLRTDVNSDETYSGLVTREWTSNNLKSN